MTDDGMLNQIDTQIMDQSQTDSPVERQNLPFSTLAGETPSNNELLVGKLERSQSLYNPVPQVSDLVIEQS
jgi:hypothetical protein